MATAKQQLINDIKDLENALKSDVGLPEDIKKDLRSEIAKSKKELEELEQAEKKAKSSKPQVKKEGEEKKKKAVDRVKERIKKTRSVKKVVAKKKKEVKEEKPTRTTRTAPKPSRKPRVQSGNKKDASRKALKPGWRKSKITGKWYYEDRSNRSDRQRKRYPYLEDGGTTDFNEGAGTFAKGGIFGDNENLSRDRMFKSNEKWEQRYKRKTSPKNPRYKAKKKISKYAGGGVTDTPKIYVADLSAYNDGKLVGEWVDLSEFDSGAEVMDKISELLKGWSESSGELREEYAIHDYENFSRSLYSEYMGEDDFDKVIKIYKIAEEKDIPADVIGTVISEYDPSDISDFIDERYEGQFDSDTDLAYHYVDMLGGIEQLGTKTAESYFDYEKFGRDLAMDYNNYDGYYFRSYKRGGQLKSYNMKKYMGGGATEFNSGAGMFANGGKISKQSVEKLLDRAFDLLNGHINNGGTLNYSDKEYGYLSDEVEDVQVGYFKDEDVDSSYAERLRERGYTLTGKEAYDILKHRIESIEEELKEYASGGTTDFTNDGAGMFAGGGGTGKKTYDIMYNIGLAKYVVNYHDGIKKHKDGSPFSDIAIFRNKKDLSDFVNKLESEGYKKIYASGGTTGEPHKLDASGDMFADGGAIVDYSYGLLADPRFDVHSSVFKKGGKVSNKFNYLSKWNIATITTDDGTVIDGNDIIDGVYVKKKVKF